MGYNASQSLISGHPPLLVFTICLTAFGLTMVVLAYVIGEKDVPNPDVQMDWNKLFKKLSELKICPMQNDTQCMSGKFFSHRGKHGNHNSEFLANISSAHNADEKIWEAVLSKVVEKGKSNKIDDSTFQDISVSVKFGLHGKVSPDSFFQSKGQVQGKLLGFTGKYAVHIFNLSLSFQSLQNKSCSSDQCHSLWEVCITMRLPSEVLPETKSPEKCKVVHYSNPDTHPSTSYCIDNHTVDFAISSDMCIDLDYTPDTKLTEMLSVHDRSIVNLHLMHTSYFMFVMVMTLICYSLIKGRYRHPKHSLSHEKLPLDA
ncbi:transmembrane protein 248-like [Uloborus diversus]|uniref:transmembrane protein 248-like n=1 Tax=Uloborus diversus TaxID=327109 RepID=UPI002409DADC|nr:transmembrane protein 248-like [Uloborus diversus]XP_054714994.1 transmembrane protein 248-like [Uloborus diversus]